MNVTELLPLKVYLFTLKASAKQKSSRSDKKIILPDIFSYFSKKKYVVTPHSYCLVNKNICCSSSLVQSQQDRFNDPYTFTPT